MRLGPCAEVPVALWLCCQWLKPYDVTSSYFPEARRGSISPSNNLPVREPGERELVSGTPVAVPARPWDRRELNSEPGNCGRQTE